MNSVGAGIANLFGQGVLRRADGTVVKFELRSDEPPVDEPKTDEVDNHGNHSLGDSPPRGG